MLRAIPNSVRIILPDSGHAALLEQEIDLSKLIRQARKHCGTIVTPLRLVNMTCVIRFMCLTGRVGGYQGPWDGGTHI